jgi:hypothetical protein
MRDAFERLLEFSACRGHAISQNQFEVPSRSQATSRVIMQQGPGMVVQLPGSDDHKVGRFSFDDPVNGPTRQ